MTQLIAEQLLLLAYRADGRAHGKSTELDMALGGALLTELVLGGYVELSGNRLVSTAAPARPAHPELATALGTAEARPRAPKALVPRLAKGARRRLLTGLVDAGVLREEHHTVLLVFTGRRYPLAEPAAREEPLRRLRAVVIGRQQPDQNTAALASLVHAAKLGRQIFPDEDQRVAKARLRELAEGDWAAAAVRKAIQAAHAATMSAITAASAGGGDGSS